MITQKQQEKLENVFSFMWLEGDQLKRLEPILEVRGWASLNNRTCRALVAYAGDTIAAFHILQFIPHPEPLWVAPKFRGTGLAEYLADEMFKFLKDNQARAYLIIADTPEAARLCEERGMKKVESPVYAYIK